MFYLYVLWLEDGVLNPSLQGHRQALCRNTELTCVCLQVDEGEQSCQLVQRGNSGWSINSA
jgi:hypothetical protein